MAPDAGTLPAGRVSPWAGLSSATERPVAPWSSDAGVRPAPARGEGRGPGRTVEVPGELLELCLGVLLGGDAMACSQSLKAETGQGCRTQRGSALASTPPGTPRPAEPMSGRLGSPPQTCSNEGPSPPNQVPMPNKSGLMKLQANSKATQSPEKETGFISCWRRALRLRCQDPARQRDRLGCNPRGPGTNHPLLSGWGGVGKQKTGQSCLTQRGTAGLSESQPWHLLPGKAKTC